MQFIPCVIYKRERGYIITLFKKGIIREDKGEMERIAAQKPILKQPWSEDDNDKIRIIFVLGNSQYEYELRLILYS